MKFFAWLVAAGMLVATFVFYASGIDLEKIAPPAQSATYTDRNGSVLGTILGSDSSHRIAVPIEVISPEFLAALVAAEDARFWHHGAIDVRSLFRAARDFAIFGEARSGGSTIEMQLARLLHPTPSTIAGKLSQILTAERIAVVSSKRAILQAYADRVPMGGNIYGVEAAARSYFGEPASDLDLAQAALLAAIPNDPTRLAPDADWEALRARQRYVLRRMVALHEISPARARFALAETVRVRLHESGIADAAHALFFLSQIHTGRRGHVTTTIERDLQRFVQAQTRDVIAALADYHVTDGAALVVENRTGNVLAYVGSPDYFSDGALGSNDGVQALRQPGSSLKPFTYELALERGTIRSTTILADAPAAYAIPGGKLYEPVDYSGRFSGPVRVRAALANSLNAPAVAVLSRLGVAPLLTRLHELGFSHLDRPPAYYGLGLTLGSGEVSLWELVQAYATIARGGVFLPLRLAAGEGAATPRAIGDQSDWELVTDMLADPFARARSFGVGSVLQMPFPAAVKTGTSSDFRDTWTVGFTPEYTVGTWVGNFDGTPMRGVSGVTGAGPLWNRIMLHLYERNAEPPPFEPPRGLVRTPICALTGHTPSTRKPCRGMVLEWVRPDQLASLARPDPVPALRIVFPHDGDVFVRNRASTALAADEQQLALRASGADGPVRWDVDGLPVATDAAGNAFWPLRLGTWQIYATDGVRRDYVTVHVVPPPANDRPGFTFLTNSTKR